MVSSYVLQASIPLRNVAIVSLYAGHQPPKNLSDVYWGSARTKERYSGNPSYSGGGYLAVFHACPQQWYNGCWFFHLGNGCRQSGTNSMSSVAAEQELIAGAISGDREALERLLLDHYDRLARHIEPKIPASQQSLVGVDDILQKTFIQAFRDVHKFELHSAGSFVAWLKAIAENRLLDTLKALKRKKRGGDRLQVRPPAVGPSSSVADLVELLSDRIDTPSRVMARREAVQAVQIGLAGLPDDQRDAVRLRYLDGATVEQTAAAMDRTPDAVRGLVHRAKQALRNTLGHSSRWLSKR